MTADEWLREVARRLGTEPPSTRDVDDVLALAALAAHASERQAAPVTCWLAARSGRQISDCLAIVREVAGELA
jgi:hypothetical protein